ncbi:hypothetical protein MMC07_006815 [Pseudocyphellaria aurata]|nr:hypothetical protein [Pseudocyphellaria aurata]
MSSSSRINRSLVDIVHMEIMICPNCALGRQKSILTQPSWQEKPATRSAVGSQTEAREATRRALKPLAASAGRCMEGPERRPGFVRACLSLVKKCLVI